MSSEVGFIGEATVKGISFAPVNSVEGTHRSVPKPLWNSVCAGTSSGELSEICTITGAETL